MAQKVLTNPSNYLAIADAIRAKGVEGSWKPSEMAAAIASIKNSGSGGSSENAQYQTNEEIYQQIRPKEWPEMPSAKQYLSENPDIWFCGYFFFKKPDDTRMYFQEKNLVTITVFGWTGDEWVQVNEFTNTSSGYSSSSYNQIPSCGTDYQYELIRVTSTNQTYANPFPKTSGTLGTTSGISNQLIEIDLCGRGTELTTSATNMFNSVYFVNIESLAEQENYYKPPLMSFSSLLQLQSCIVIRKLHIGGSSAYLLSSGSLTLTGPEEPYYSTQTVTDVVQNGDMNIQIDTMITRLTNSSGSSVNLLGSYSKNPRTKLKHYIVGKAPSGTGQENEFTNILVNNSSFAIGYCGELSIEYLPYNSDYPEKCHSYSYVSFANLTQCNKAILKAVVDFATSEQVEYARCNHHNISISNFYGVWDEEVDQIVQKANDGGWTVTVSKGGPLG